MTDFTKTFADIDGDKLLVERQDPDNLTFTRGGENAVMIQAWRADETRESVPLIFEQRDALHIAQEITRAAGYEVEVVWPEEATPATLHGEDERAGWNIDALTAAAEYGREAEFTYQKPDDDVLTHRRLEVDHLDATKAGEIIVVGYDKTKADVRVFRVDRIVGFVTVR